MGVPVRVWRRALAIALLLVAAVWTTLHSPTIFFDQQILLGSSLGVLALLEFGWAGLPVGVASALCSVVLWGHPWAALVLVLQLLWQQIFLSRFNGGPRQVGNGRIVLCTIVFWLLLGIPLKTALYTGVMHFDLTVTLPLVFKEAVVGVVNAAVGLLLHLLLHLLRLRRSSGDLSLRGLTFATLLLMISLPGVLIIGAMGQQLTSMKLGEFRHGLQDVAEDLAWQLPASGSTIPDTPFFRQQLGAIEFRAEAESGRSLDSDPGLFDSLQQQVCGRTQGLARHHDLTLVVNRAYPTALQRCLESYWRYELSDAAAARLGWRRITLVSPAQPQIRELTAMMRPSLQILGALLVAAALASELVTTLLAAQINRILQPANSLAAGPQDAAAATSAAAVERQPAQAMPLLQNTQIRELNAIVSVINDQGRAVNALSSELAQINERLQRSEQQHRLLADNALDVITICDASGRPTYISPSIERVRGWSVAEAMELPMERHFDPEGLALVRQALAQTQEALERGLPLPDFRYELRQSHRDGSWIWTDVTSSCIVDEAGRYIGTLLVYRDISERKRLEKQLLQRATIDELTGLLTRRELLDKLEQLLDTPARHRWSGRLALLFCDLDLFKEINDSLGHSAGDAVLRVVAQRIRRCIRSGDLAARMGGDEMVVVLRSVADRESAVAVAEKISAAIAQPLFRVNVASSITASIGIALSQPGESLDGLMARADIAMYRAKQAGRGRVVALD